MKKKIKYVLLLFLLGTFFCVRVSADTEFVLMKNGDYSKSGYGSVTEELTSYEIDTMSYQLGTKENKALMMAEGERNIYLYIYDKNKYMEYDKISLSVYYGDSSARPTLDQKNLLWQEFDLELVSYDSTHFLQKYKIQKLSFLENEYHSIYVREIYNHSKRTDKSFIFSVGFSYQFNPITKQSKVDTEETIRVTDKKVAYEIFPQNDGVRDYIFQRSYVAFSTDKKMEDLIEVKLKYNGFDYVGYTDIELDYSSNAWDLKLEVQDFSKALTNKNIYNHVDKTRFFEKGKEYKDYRKSIKNEKIELTYSNGFWWSKKTGNWIYNTIESTSTLKEKPTSLSDTSILNYDYVISFDNRKVDCLSFVTSHYKVLWVEEKSVGGILIGVKSINNDDKYHFNAWNPFESPSFTEKDITNVVIKENTIITSNQMLEVEDLTLLEFHYIENGEVKNAIAVDTYDDSVGGSQFTDNSVYSPFLNFWNSLCAFLKSNTFKRILKIALFVLIGVVCVVILISLIKKKGKKK